MIFPRPVVLGTCVLALAEAAVAQSYPARPVLLIVPAAPGGATSTTAFMLRDRLRERLKQAVVVEHKGGANGIIGTGLVTRAAADGYTLLLGSMSHITLNPNLYRNLPYVPIKDLTPVSMVSTFPLLVVAHPSLPAGSVKELIAFARSNPGKVNFGSAGLGNSSHLAGELLAAQTGISITHVPYKGGGGLVVAVLANEISLMFATPQTVVSHIGTGKLKALAVTSSNRSALYPDLPTVAEAGVSGFAVDSWNGIFAPAGTPRELISRLHTEIVGILQTPAGREEMLKAGMEPVVATTEQFTGVIRTETDRWAKLIRDKGIVIDQ